MKNPPAFLVKSCSARDDPLIFAILGLCPVLAVATSAVNSIAISVVFFVVLIISRIALSLIGKWTGPVMAVFVLLTVSSTLTAAADMAVRAFFPIVHDALGTYLSLIAVNCLIITRSGLCGPDEAPKASAGSVAGTIKTGSGFVIIILISGIAREVLGNGTLLGDPVLGAGFRASPVSFFILPPGAFLVIAFLTAFVNSRLRRSKGPVKNAVMNKGSVS